ncbi:hypothetical protein ACQJBY_042583 [Aegilops geniculata]
MACDGDSDTYLKRIQAETLRNKHKRACIDQEPHSPAGSPASSSPETGFEEHAGKVSSSELGCTSTDLANFETLTLNDTPHTLESADRVVMHADAVDGAVLDSTLAEPPAHEKQKPRREIPRKYWPPKYEGDIKFAEEQARKQAESIQERGHYISSKEELAQNGNRWMTEEAMVAFRRYIESEDDLKGVEYEFDELLHQCFNVEHYLKICHHFTFTVKIKKHGSADWTSVMYFAEVRGVFMIKDYFCYPLDPDENGQCYVCQNQGMHELRHPSVGIFGCGKEDASFPYYCEESDSDEYHPKMEWSESDDDMS